MRGELAEFRYHHLFFFYATSLMLDKIWHCDIRIVVLAKLLIFLEKSEKV